MDQEQAERHGPGQRVTWIEVKRSGYGYPMAHDAVVVRVTQTRVVIRVQRWDGAWVQRTVRASSLRLREAGEV